MMAWPRAVLFDFDGTLADSYAAIASSVNHVRTLNGYPPLPVGEVKRHVGHGAAHLLRHTVPDVDLEPALQAYRVHHASIMKPLTHLLPGAADALNFLHARHVRLGVCSNKPSAFTRELLTYLDVVNFFDVVLGPEDVPSLKPAPDMLLAALQRLNVVAKDVLYVGDMTVDVQTARAAGAPVWVVCTGSDPRHAIEAAHPDKILDSLTELPAAIQ